jgi:hypothetical protein
VLTASANACYTPRGGTYTWTCTKAMVEVVHPDRVVIITDEQAHDSDRGEIAVPVITWNLAGYAAHHAPHGTKNRLYVGGYSDTTLQVLPALISVGSGRWPWE